MTGRSILLPDMCLSQVTGRIYDYTDTVTTYFRPEYCVVWLWRKKDGATGLQTAQICENKPCYFHLHIKTMILYCSFSLPVLHWHHLPRDIKDYTDSYASQCNYTAEKFVLNMPLEWLSLSQFSSFALWVFSRSCVPVLSRCTLPGL